MSEDEIDFILSENRIVKDAFEADVVKTVEIMLRKGKRSTYDLNFTKKHLESAEIEDENLVFLHFFNNRASVVTINREFYEYVFDKIPKIGDILTNYDLQIAYESKICAAGTLAIEIPLLQFHIAFEKATSKYLTGVNLYYLEWFLQGKNYYFGKSNLSKQLMQILTLLTLSQTKGEFSPDSAICFAKSLVKEILQNENKSNSDQESLDMLENANGRAQSTTEPVDVPPEKKGYSIFGLLRALLFD